MEEIIKYLIYSYLVLIPCSLIYFFHHHKRYKLAINSLRERGINIKNFETTYLDYGSAGCTMKIYAIKHKYKNTLSEYESTMLDDSKKFHNYSYWCIALPITALIALLLISIAQKLLS